MARYSCRHHNDKSRLSAILGELPLDKQRNCPDCCTSKVPDMLQLLKEVQQPRNFQRIAHPLSIVQYLFDRVMELRKGTTAPAHKEKWEELLDAWAKLAYRRLSDREVSSFAASAKQTRLSRPVLKQMYQALGIAALKSQGVYDEWVVVEPGSQLPIVVSGLNDMIFAARDRAVAIENAAQVDIMLEMATKIKMLSDDIIPSLPGLVSGFHVWDAAASKR